MGKTEIQRSKYIYLNTIKLTIFTDVCEIKYVITWLHGSLAETVAVTPDRGMCKVTTPGAKQSRASQWRLHANCGPDANMMTPSNGNIFRITGHLCGEFTGDGWIPRTNGQWHGALMFSLICAWINGWVNNREVIWNTIVPIMTMTSL